MLSRWRWFIWSASPETVFCWHVNNLRVIGSTWIQFCWCLCCVQHSEFWSNQSDLCFWPDCKPEGPLFSAEFVCVSVCLWPALLPFNVNRFWWNLVARSLLWSSLATAIMVQIGRRGIARRLFENFKKFSKIAEFEVQNSGPSLFCACVSCVL